MNTHYTVRLTRADRPEYGAATPIVGGEYSATLFVVALNAEEACRCATEHMTKETGKNDWKVRSLDENCCPPCDIPGRY